MLREGLGGKESERSRMSSGKEVRWGLRERDRINGGDEIRDLLGFEGGPVFRFWGLRKGSGFGFQFRFHKKAFARCCFRWKLFCH